MTRRTSRTLQVLAIAALLAMGILLLAETRKADADSTRHGTWAYAAESYGPLYLAIPEGPGFDVRICGPLDCLERVSTDAGPELWLQRKGRIGDLSSRDFLTICGPLSAGLCSGSYTILGVADQHPEDPPEHPDDARMRLEDRPLPATDAL